MAPLAQSTTLLVLLFVNSCVQSAEGTPLLSTLSNSTSLRAGATSCSPSFAHLGSGKEGFDVCLFGKTGNLLTTYLSSFGNAAWVLENALSLGNCICNQACTPSQIVCEDAPAVKWFIRFFLFSNGGNINLLNSFAQFVYALENYQAFCYCPKLIPAGTDPCDFTGQQAKPCPFPTDGNKKIAAH